MQTDYPSANGDNNSLRAVSLSYSANESLKGGSGMKHSPGVVTAVDSLEGELLYFFDVGTRCCYLGRRIRMKSLLYTPVFS